MHPIGQLLNFDSCTEFQGRGTEHFHSPIHVIGAPKIDEADDKDVIEFIDQYVTCSIPDEKCPELNGLVKKVQTQNGTTTCKKRKGVTCRFNAPWPPSEEKLTQRNKDIDKTELAVSKKLLIK